VDEMGEWGDGRLVGLDGMVGWDGGWMDVGGVLWYEMSGGMSGMG
jgi:hypothetical protein